MEREMSVSRWHENMRNIAEDASKEAQDKKPREGN